MYTATVAKTADLAEEKTARTDSKEVTIAKKGHSYGEPVWTWAEDYSSATAKSTCANDKNHVKEVKATIASETTEATTSAEGKTVYTAKVTIDGKEYTDTKTVVIPKLTPEEPAADDSSKQEEPAADDSSKQEEPAADDSSKQEEPAADDQKEEPSTPAEEPTAPAEEPTAPAEEPAAPAEEPATQPATPGTMFTDVADESNIYKPVSWAVNAGIVKGYSDNTFKPEESCTREQFAIMMWRFAGQPDADISAADKFTDIASFSNNTSRKAVAWAVSEGIINGFNDGHFGPQETVTRRQVVIMLWRWTGRPTATETADFSDVDPSESTYKAIQWGAEAGLVKGYSDGTFKPEDPCQRQHIVIFLYRYARDVLNKDVTL